MKQIDLFAELLQSSSWYQAMTLNERIAALQSGASESTFDNATGNVAYAQVQMQRWRTQRPFQSDDTFLQWLEINQLNEIGFQYILTQDVDSLREQLDHVPDWLTNVYEIYTQSDEYTSIGEKTLLFDDTHQLNKLLVVAAPWLYQSRKRLQKEVKAFEQERKALPFNVDTIYDILMSSFAPSLLQIIERTLILEMHVARLQNRLTGNTSQERFESFVKQLQQPDTTLSLLHEYPVLTRLMIEAIERWECVSLEFLHRLCSDWDSLCLIFDIDPTCHLTELQVAGDIHHNGRAVSILTFNSGFRIVYKPRSLAIYQHIQDILHWFNTQYANTYNYPPIGEHPLFRGITVVNRESYGWMEYVSSQYCTSSEEIQRFYYRQGAYLAFLRCIAANDIHYENIIAAGEHPVLIDLETLFQPQFDKSNISTVPSEQTAMQDMQSSVLGVGILPYLLWTNDEFVGVELSGLGGKRGQINPRRTPHWEDIGTDSIHIVYKNVEMLSAHNRPLLNGMEVSAFDYTETIVQGFTDMYKLLVDNRTVLLDKNGPFMWFAQDQIRVLVRPTLVYMLLLQGGYHPDVLRDALDRDRFFDKLWEDTLHQPILLEVIAAEHRSLWHGDIPMFVTQPSSVHLWSTDGTCIHNFFNESGLTNVYQRMQRLDNDDLHRQQWFIRAAMTAQAFDRLSDENKPLSYPSSYTVAGATNLVETASAIGERLVQLAWCSDDTASWIGIEEVRGQSTRVRCLGPELYNGTAGIALFLAWLGHMTKEERYTHLAQAAVTNMRQQLIRYRDFGALQIGGFDGIGGIIYTLVQLGSLWGNHTLIEEAEALLTDVTLLIESDKAFDIMAGSAGCIVSVLGLYHYTKSPKALEIAITCGNHIVANAQSMDVGFGWFNHIPSSQPLTGFSHGTSGIAWALLELAEETNITLFRETAIAALQYEHSLFSQSTKSWPDFRVVGLHRDENYSSSKSSPCFWCHGTSGIGLVRLHILKHYDTPQIRRDIDISLQKTLADGFGSSHCLCHGDLGNLELLLQAGMILGDDHWYKEVSRITSSVLEQAQQHGWKCGIPMGIETPGLMTGLAGIGYQLLRLADPEQVPSILTLELPTPSTH